MRRIRLTPGTTAPRGLNMTVTMPAAAPAPTPPSGGVSCGPIALVCYRTANPGLAGPFYSTDEISLSSTEPQSLYVFFAGTIPPDSYIEFVEPIWVPVGGSIRPGYSILDDGEPLGLPFYQGYIYPYGPGHIGELTIYARLICADGSTFDTAPVTIDVVDLPS